MENNAVRCNKDEHMYENVVDCNDVEGFKTLSSYLFNTTMPDRILNACLTPITHNKRVKCFLVNKDE